MPKAIVVIGVLLVMLSACNEAQEDYKPEMLPMKVPKFFTFDVHNEGIEMIYNPFDLDPNDSSYVYACGISSGSRIGGSQLWLISNKMDQIDANKALIDFDDVKSIMFDCSYMDSTISADDSMISLFNIREDSLFHGKRFVLEKRDFNRCFELLKTDSSLVMDFNIFSKDKKFFSTSDKNMKYGGHMMWSYRLLEDTYVHIRTAPDLLLYTNVDPNTADFQIVGVVSSIKYTW